MTGRDHKPPQDSGDERTTLVALLQYVRESVVRKVEGISDDDARRSPVPTGTSLLWLVTHLARAEALWVLQRFAGQEVSAELLRGDPAAEDTIDDAVARYRLVWSQVDEVIARSDFDAPLTGMGKAVTLDLRWVVAHLVEETARHAGHADILRELIDGATGR